MTEHWVPTPGGFRPATARSLAPFLEVDLGRMTEASQASTSSIAPIGAALATSAKTETVSPAEVTVPVEKYDALYAAVIEKAAEYHSYGLNYYEHELVDLISAHDKEWSR